MLPGYFFRFIIYGFQTGQKEGFIKMQEMTISQITKAVKGQLLCGKEEAVVHAVTTDSRQAASQTLFIPIIGERFDGHDFIENVWKQGGSAVLTQKEIPLPAEGAVIRVENTFEALADLAGAYKKQYPVPTVAVTGSVGKTTTKDMLASVLGKKYCALKTQGNFNNEIGVPLTIFRLEKEHQAAVIEMGMSGFGEIRKLASVAQPDVAVITNIGMSHIEKLGSQEGIFKAKMEVAEQFGPDQILIVNGDDSFLSATKGKGKYKVLYYGIHNPENDVSAKNIINAGIEGVRFTACVEGKEYPVVVPVAGEHNVYNALSAICVGRCFQIPMEQILQGIADFELTAMRMSVEEKHGITVINDCYNASPDSVRAALAVLEGAPGRRKVAVLGDILEMGSFAREAHQQLGKSVAEKKVDVLITAGENASHLAKAAEEEGVTVYAFQTTEEACAFVKTQVKRGDAVLIKASRGMKFETIYEAVSEIK